MGISKQKGQELLNQLTVVYTQQGEIMADIGNIKNQLIGLNNNLMPQLTALSRRLASLEELLSDKKPLTNEPTRVCVKCGKEKPVSKFPYKTGSKVNYCGDCEKEYGRNYRERRNSPDYIPTSCIDPIAYYKALAKANMTNKAVIEQAHLPHNPVTKMDNGTMFYSDTIKRIASVLNVAPQSLLLKKD